MDRIKAVANDAEEERMREVEKMKKQVKDLYERTGRKMKVNLESVGGGKRVVDQMLGPTVRAIGVATGLHSEGVGN
ncbi:MAG: RNA polymerase II transcription factor B subunit 1 [Pleopsidium flavum]|nr:MAG: RNA polymerase II transcription factor B subunit 1 [Pleopsidium flavum]